MGGAKIRKTAPSDRPGAESGAPSREVREMRMRSSWSSFAVWFAVCGLVATVPLSAARALKAPSGLSNLEEADRKALETIAGNDAKLRDAVLKASLHIDALVETQRIQEQSSASFQDRIGKLDKKQQEQVWEIVREPGLLDELTAEDELSRSQLDEIAQRHPDSLAPAIRTFGGDQHDLLVDIAQVHHRASERFDAAIEDLDADTQQAFRDLVDEPELMSVLVHRVNLVVRLGDSYRKNPRDTRSYLTALAADVDKRKAADQEEWKKRIESDPKAAAELDEAARDYADENGYDYDELTRPDVRTRVDVVVHPYPYWFGYPIWYSDLYLYPYGYWYPYPVYFGYYHYHDSFVWWGFPSFTFVNWFYFGHHYHHYTYLSNCFTHQFVGRRFAPTYVNVTVNNFVTHTDRIDRHRGDGSWERGGDRSRGGETRNVNYSNRDRGFFFNRSRSEDGQVGRRTAPGERGAVMGPSRGGFERGNGRGHDARGQVRPQAEAGVERGDATRGHGRRGDGANARGRGEQPAHQQDQPRFFQRPDAQQQRGGVEPRGRRQEREWSHSPRVIREEPRVERPAPSGGGERRGFGGGDAPAVRGGGGDGGGRGHGSGHGGAPSARSEQGQSGGFPGGGMSGGGDGGSRGGGGHGWGGGNSGGGNSGGGWGRGGSRGGGGDFGGGGFPDGGGHGGGGRGR
jgi:hypothetical protein